jgi:hypothetical protein
MAKGFHSMADEDRRFLKILRSSAIGIHWFITQPDYGHQCALCEAVVVELRPTSRKRRVHLNRVLHLHEAKHAAQFSQATRSAALAALALGVRREEIVEQVLGFPSREALKDFMRYGKVFGETT